MNYRIVKGSSFGHAFFEIQAKKKFFGISYWEKHHVIYINKSDAELAYRQAKKLMKQLENIENEHTNTRAD